MKKERVQNVSFSKNKFFCFQHANAKEMWFDPQGASSAEIKKAYRALSKSHHPDKGGDPKKFMKISKAYAA